VVVDGRRYAHILVVWGWCDSCPIVARWWQRRPESQIDDPTVPLAELRATRLRHAARMAPEHAACRVRTDQEMLAVRSAQRRRGAPVTSMEGV
jgi:hypothetical protein